jgi:hypothetical protein
MEMEGGWGGHGVWIGVAGGCRGGETDTESAKIVVVSSCEGTLLWFHQALMSLEIESTLSQQFNELPIDGFLASPIN